MKMFQFTKPFSHMIEHLEYKKKRKKKKSFLYVHLYGRQSVILTSFYLLKIAIPFVLFKCPRDTLQSGSNR